MESFLKAIGSPLGLLVLALVCDAFVPEKKHTYVTPFSRRATRWRSPLFLWPDVPMSRVQVAALIMRDLSFLGGLGWLILNTVIRRA